MEKARERTVDAATARELAVKAACDPRTILGVLSGKIIVKTMSSRRAYAVLVETGWIKEAQTQERAA